MKPAQLDLCAAVVIIGHDEPQDVSQSVLDRLAELELLANGKLTDAGERLFGKIERGDDIAEFN